MNIEEHISRRNFIATGSTLVAGALVANPLTAMPSRKEKMKVVLVGTGVRGTSMWGRSIVQQYKEPGRICRAL